MNMPCIVEKALQRHIYQRNSEEAREAHIEELAEARYQFLTQDRPGVSLITESLYMNDSDYPLDEALFTLLSAWRSGKDVMEEAIHLVILLRKKAERMARQWAEWEVWREENQAQTFDEDVPW